MFPTARAHMSLAATSSCLQVPQLLSALRRAALGSALPLSIEASAHDGSHLLALGQHQAPLSLLLQRSMAGLVLLDKPAAATEHTQSQQFPFFCTNWQGLTLSYLVQR